MWERLEWVLRAPRSFEGEGLCFGVSRGNVVVLDLARIVDCSMRPALGLRRLWVVGGSMVVGRG